MRKNCDAQLINCPNAETRMEMQIAVNFGGKLRTYCCVECANDDIRECSDGLDSIKQAINEHDVFILTISPT